MKEPRRDKVDKPVRRNNWTTAALIFGLALLAIIIFFFARGGNSNEDRLTNVEVASSTPPPVRDKLCSSTATYDRIKQELFRSAAELRGRDQPIFDRLSQVAVVRMENPAMESEDRSTGAVNCSGSLSLDLPPGIIAAGGRRTLMGDVDYTVTASSNGSGPIVLLHNADSLVRSLAALTELPEAGQATSEDGDGNEAAGADASGAGAGPSTGQAQSAPPAGRPSSFNCSAVQNQSETILCNDPGLLALDREMSAQFVRAVAVASPAQQALLRDTGRRFQAFLDRCSTRSCIANAYAGRMREIGDILQDRWQAPR